MVEVTQEVRAAPDRFVSGSIRRALTSPDWQLLESVMTDLFNAGRASVLAELESPTEAMLNSCMGNNGIGPLTAATVWTAMIGAYKEAL